MTDPSRPLRLGFPVKVMGRPDLKSQDTRRWQKNPHLKCSLELLDKVLDYLAAEKLDARYRLFFRGGQSFDTEIGRAHV